MQTEKIIVYDETLYILHNVCEILVHIHDKFLAIRKKKYNYIEKKMHFLSLGI